MKIIAVALFLGIASAAPTGSRNLITGAGPRSFWTRSRDLLTRSPNLSLRSPNLSTRSPNLSFKIRDGNFGGLGEGLGLNPVVSWESETDAGDVNLSYGIEATVKATKDIASLPRTIWGQARTDVNGWDLTARAEFEGVDFTNANFDIDADNKDLDLTLRLEANAGKDLLNVQRVEATKGFDTKGAHVTVTPRFNLVDDERDVVVSYSKDRTIVLLTASAENQEVTFSQQIDNYNRVAPTVTSKGDFSVEWEHLLGNDNSLIANLKPNSGLDVEWRDGAWTANINFPIAGTNINGANVSVMRDVNF